MQPVSAKTESAPTMIYYSRGILIIAGLFLLLFLITTCISFSRPLNPFMASAIIILCTWLLYKIFRRATDKIPQIIISNEGLQTRKAGFFPWAGIHNETIIKSQGKDGQRFLVYDCPAGPQKISISNYAVSHQKLIVLLSLYRKRNYQLSTENKKN